LIILIIKDMIVDYPKQESGASLRTR